MQVANLIMNVGISLSIEQAYSTEDNRRRTSMMGCGDEGDKQDFEFRPISRAQQTVSYSLNEDSL
jgi:hypothetical protein